MKKKFKKKAKILILLCVILIVFVVVLIVFSRIGFAPFLKLSIEKSKVVEVGKNYNSGKLNAFYNKKDLTRNIKRNGNVNTKKIGKYKVVYTIKYKKIQKSLTQIVKVVDKTPPELTLLGDDLIISKNKKIKDIGYKAIDNYDGDITKKVKLKNSIDTAKPGEYELVYEVKDSSGNKSSAKRKVTVVENMNENQQIAVLNYHFFYDNEKGESCSDSNCIDAKDFKAQLSYLKDNGYKALTMQEFKDWKYGDIELPEKSVLITIDDGALGTGIQNGNKLIPILEEYKMHATLFLITGWWSIDNYKSEYLDIESHTNDMHTERVCEGVSRGAKMLCLSKNEVLEDLKRSISVTNSKLAFCFPFYAYTDETIDDVKQAGFSLAFIGGGRKAMRSVDPYHIPRYQIKQQTSLDQFIKYVS